MPPPDALAKVREAIAVKSANWKKLKENTAFRKYFDGVRGEGLTRPPRGFDPEHPFIEDIKRKSFYAMHEATPKLAGSSSLIDEVSNTFAALGPLMKFLCTAVEVPY